MSLTTVGVTVNFAIDLEASTAAFYETATTITQSQDLKSLFEALIIQGQGRIQKLMHLRQQLSLDQKKTEVIDLKGEPYRPKTECPPGCPDYQLIQLALTMEQQVQDFYRDSGDKLGFVEEIPVLFEYLAKDHLQNQNTLQTLS